MREFVAVSVVSMLLGCFSSSDGPDAGLPEPDVRVLDASVSVADADGGDLADADGAGLADADGGGLPNADGAALADADGGSADDRDSGVHADAALPECPRWVPMPSLTDARFGAAAVAMRAGAETIVTINGGFNDVTSPTARTEQIVIGSNRTASRRSGPPNNLARANHAMVAVGNDIYMVGGSNVGGTGIASPERWISAQNGVGSWAELTNMANTPPGGALSSHGASIAYDVAQNKLHLFGGVQQLDLMQVCSRLELDVGLSTPAWSGCLATPTPPAPRAYAFMAFDSRGRLLVFGGLDQFNPQRPGPGGLHVLTLGTNTWTPLSSRESERYGAAGAYDDSRRQVILFGGQTGNLPATRSNTVLVGDLSGVPGQAPAWRELFPIGGSVSARSFAAAAYEPSTSTFVIAGGRQVNESPTAEVWLLQNPFGPSCVNPSNCCTP